MVPITILLSLLCAIAVAEASDSADFHQNGGVRGGTNAKAKQQQHGRWMQDAPIETQLPPTDSPEATDEVHYSPIYNTRMKACIGYEAEGLKGYTTLDDLRHDLQLYFYDMNGYNYHRTAEVIAAELAAAAMTESPTGHPSASPSVSLKPSVTSSDVPSTIPTQQPVTAAPTDEPTSSVRLPVVPTKSPSPTMLPKFAGGSSPGSLFGTDVVDNDDDDGTYAPIPIPSLRTASPSRIPTSKPIELDENMKIERSVGERVREQSNVTFGSVRRRLQEHETTTTPITVSLKESSVVESSRQEEGDEIYFHICPDTNFQFDSILVAQLKYLPLVLETPVQQPVKLACLEENTCTFSGGEYHIVFNNNGLADDGLGEDNVYSTITVSGITFEESEEASIVMNDPRGKVIFDNCKWEKNQGEAIVVDGKYSGTNLERDYYGVNDFMLPPGKENPYASTEPTMPAVTTAFSFFTSTVNAMTTEQSNFVGRLLEEMSAAGSPKSVILIRKSIFTGNKGKATIAVDSYSEDDEDLGSDPSASGPIHLKLEKSEFSSQRVRTSVIVTSGATVSSTGNVFEGNTASSMIQTNSGTITITDTDFGSSNVVTGEGVVVVDSSSKVGDTNCVEESGEEATDTAPVSSSRGDTTLPAGLCEGTVVTSEGICQPFGQVCDPHVTPTLLSMRGVVRESASIVDELPSLSLVAAYADSHVASESGSVNVEVETKISPMTMERGKSKSGKSAKQANQRPQQQQVSISNGRNKKDKGKSKKSKSSKPKRGSGRKRRRKRGH